MVDDLWNEGVPLWTIASLVYKVNTTLANSTLKHNISVGE